MITPAHSNLAFSLAQHYFGDGPASVIRALFNCDQASLKLLRFYIPELKLQDLKRSLLVLINYNLVDYIKTVNNVEYSIVPSRFFAFFRISKFISSSVDSSLSETSFKQAADSVERLSRSHRDALITKTIFSYYNQESIIFKLAEALLQCSKDNTSDDAAITAPVPLADLAANLVPTTIQDRRTLESYLTKLSSESNNRFIITSGIHPVKGPMYALDVGFTIDYLVREHLSSVITTKFGPKCCRVFRILLARGPLLMKQVEELIMLPARDVREYSYMLIKEGFVRNRQVPRTLDNASGKSLFIMLVDLGQVVASVTDLCCMSMSNLLARYNHELNQHGVLLEKSKAVQELIKNSDEDWNQYFSSHELTVLDWINRVLNKILIAKNQVDDTLFLFHWWTIVRPNMKSDEIS